jgi:hypothetical protein
MTGASCLQEGTKLAKPTFCTDLDPDSGVPLLYQLKADRKHETHLNTNYQKAPSILYKMERPLK